MNNKIQPFEILKQMGRKPFQEVYKDIQLDMLEIAEGKNKSFSKPTIYFPIILSLIEPIGVFFITNQNQSDPLISIFAALFPLLLVWGLAYLFADKFEIHKEYEKLITYYDFEFNENYKLNYPKNENKFERDIDNLTSIQLIPHDIDYQEQKIQHYVEVLSSNERKHITVIKAEAEKKFFEIRKEELENIKDKRLIPLPEDRINNISQDYIPQQSINPDSYEIEVRNNEIDKNFTIRGEIIRQRIDNLLKLCDNRIKRALEQIEEHNKKDRRIIGQDIKEIDQSHMNIDEDEY